ncbi:hypothetical protein SAMN05216276_105724 [Streptosporangium subroseum]|uniref:Uncharacterized protein n=1 Tax=Streptosporangium subroseum TaxID=106412 RepID=A0A239NHM0_9ACTN|nr:hypothetical protein [Streptosporangium subroseum]SNT53828.1 hypothetical protein SAMN05216276_105724 [Streptosporangium subroseum]
MESVPASTPTGPGRPSPPGRPPRPQRAGAAGAYAVLAGALMSLIGTSWDVQWHVDVGPDTFFTLPHLVLYSGSAVAGIAALVMVLRATFAQRAGRPADPTVGGSPVRVLGGTFTAPLGYLVAGTGGALFLLYGLLDLWWHSLYGFDAVLNSPPHIALFVSISLTMLGGVIVFSAARARRWGRIGLVLTVPVLLTFTPITFGAFNGLGLPVDPKFAGTVFFAVCLVLMSAITLRHRWVALSVAAVLGVLQLFLWWFSPWAAKFYADYVGLPLRDNLRDVPPELAAGMPMFMLAAALVIEALLRLGRGRGWSARRLPQLTGAAGGVVVGLSMIVQTSMLRGGAGGGPMGRSATSATTVLTDAILGLAFGALAGYLAARFAVLLRLNAPAADQEGR